MYDSKPNPKLVELLKTCVSSKASDLHLSSGLPPAMRRNGDMYFAPSSETMQANDVLVMVTSVMTDAQKNYFGAEFECDLSFDLDGVSRFRINAFMTHRGSGAVFRVIPSKVHSLAELRAPAILAELVMRPRGLLLVTGPTGSGKSTTLASMVDHRNRHHAGHILTVEDPIEFLHHPVKSLISQRELGRHTRSFSNALRAALREDPDVIMVGELRDLETIRLALTAAETGHLVLGTLHTSSAAKSVDRLIDVFPAEEKDMVRAMLSESLQAVVSQVLCKTPSGDGRVAAHEVMIGTTAIRNQIREGKIANMNSLMQTGANQGMVTLDQALQTLVRNGLVNADEAAKHATSRERSAAPTR